MNKRNRLIGISCLLLVVVIINGCSGSDSTTYATTLPAVTPDNPPVPDTTTPLVQATTPESGATLVALNSAISATFSEAIDPATLDASSFTITGITGTVSISGDQRSATFTPSEELAPDTSYTATLTTVIKDKAGNGLASNFIWSFTTGAVPDITSPVLILVSPESGTMDQAVANAAISAQFNEVINCTTVTSDSFQVLEMGLAVPGNVQCNGMTITFHPSSGTVLPTNTELMATLTPVITDLAGNPITSYSWTFGIAPWTRQFGSSDIDYGRALISDAAGNLYVAGFTRGALDNQTNAGNYDLFITKHDAAGTRLWVRQLGTASNDFAYALASDSAGNIYAAGYTEDSLHGQTSATDFDIIITKYDANGVHQWTRQPGTPDRDVAYALTSDTAGNIYAAGYTDGALDGQTNAGLQDLFITKYDTSGTRLWTRQLGSAASDYANSITSDAAGNIYVAGYTWGALDGQASAGGTDLFITKYNASGVKQWTRQLGTAENDVAYAISSDSAGNIYAAGGTAGALDGQSNAGSSDLFITKYDASGTMQWTRLLGSAGWDFAYALTTDSAGNVYAAGYTDSALDGQTSAGFQDLIITKFDANGIKQWTRQLGTASWEYATALTRDVADNIFVAGYTAGALDGQSNAGQEDIFIVKYHPGGRKR